MEMKLRQRIIGAVVVAALAIIFIPLLFKGTAPSATHQTQSIKIAAEIPPEPAKPMSPQTITMIQDKDLNTATPDNTATLDQKQPTNTTAKVAMTNEVGDIDNADDDTLNAAATATAQTTSTQTTGTTDNVIAVPVTKTTKPTKTSATVTAQAHSSKTATKHDVKQASKHPTEKMATTKLAKETTTAKTATTNAHHSTLSNSAVTKHPVDKKTKSTLASASTATSTSGIAWVVQLGSFANVTNAKQLETELRSHGFKAYTQNIKSPLGNLVRVAIGPEVKREKADAIKVRLAKEMQIKSVVVAYNPTAENI